MCWGKHQILFDIHIELLANDQYTHFRGRRYKIQAQKQKNVQFVLFLKRQQKINM